MSVEEQISQLIDKYKGLDARRLKQFNEENTKKDFILPLFRHLGWDVTNSDEVAAEEKSSNGRVDYAFKIGGVSKFYLEAKPLREDLNQRLDWAKQVVTYAENKGVTWAVLTNFKQLMVFNAEWDEPALERARFLNLTYQEYLPAFHKLWWLSRDSVEKGVLNEEARQVGALKPKLPVEKSLLDQLLRWRKELFNQIYQHNRERGLELYQVDELIQQFINRLIFIRSTEDRGIEENRLRATLHQWRESERKGELVERMRAIFHEFFTLYDSDLFPLLDTWDSLIVESDTIEKIIEGSYERPTRLAGYDFAAIDADVLGAVYEQYLGYVAQVAREEAKKRTAQARLLGFEAPAFELEAKRIKRKQQGIYYTPKFVVDYIVKETVGRFIKEHSYNDIFNIKILDPACGSGSFLVRAYDELLHYHARQQGKSPAELDHLERRPILLRNIFGVDLDRQAVEITRLGLLLRSLAKREILPSLKDNIREGNSLISGTEEELRHYFGDDWEEKKRFNWEEEFKDIMANGGFDVVIGNPPYVRPHKLETSDKEALWAQYQVYRAKSDIYACFIQRAVDLLKPGGYASYIVSNTFMSLESFAPLRKYILDTCCVLYFGLTPKKVFQAATVDTVVLGIKKESSEHTRQQNKVLITEYRDGTFERVKEIPQAIFYSTYSNIFDLSWDEATLSLHSRIELNTDKLFEVVGFCYGLKTGDDAVFLTYAPTTPEHKRLLRRSDFGRFSTEYKGEFVWYVPGQMREHRTTARPGNRERFERPKILIQDIGKHLIGTLDDDHFYVKDALMLHQRENGLDLKFVLALINSKLMNYWYVQKFATLSVAKNAILTLPIRRIDFNSPKDKKMHEDIVALVSKMLELNKRLAPIRNTSFSERDELLSEIKRIDAEIDQKVYELYGLTEEEIQIIEASLVSKSSSRSQ
ncbi:Type IIS restriction enzyme Eco57I [subsurface metagenome]